MDVRVERPEDTGDPVCKFMSPNPHTKRNRGPTMNDINEYMYDGAVVLCAGVMFLALWWFIEPLAQVVGVGQ